MRPYYEKNGITIYHGDMRKVLRTLPEASVDCVCTDAPYGLGFMEKDWDQSVPRPEYWRAILQVCKPGALLLAFGGTRTYHRLTCAIEDAGWEIRDCLMWLYGSGFPKAPDIGKLIDKAKGVERQIVGSKTGLPGYSLKHSGAGGVLAGRADGSLDNSEAECAITAPATPEAEQWSGWASALKPAWEPIVLAMKPLDGTQAHNALVYGVAGMNIDACRIETSDTVCIHSRTAEAAKSKGIYGNGAATVTHQTAGQQLGRYPANLLLDEEAATLLDEQTGTLKSGTNCVRSKPGDGYHGGMGKAGDVQTTYGDSGGASRFFYCGKATRKERGEGNDHSTVKPLSLMKYLLTLLSTPTGGLILDPFAGSGTTALAAKQLGRPCVCVELEEHHCEIIARRLDSD